MTLAQSSYTREYIDSPPTTFTYTDNVVLERFHPTATHTDDGLVAFRAFTGANSTEDMQVIMVNSTGAIQVVVRYRLPNNTDMEPVAAAYNSNTQKYIVVRTAPDLLNTGRTDMWYLLLDADLGFLHLGCMELGSNFAIAANTNGTVVTDVCPVLKSTPNDIDFAFVGTILESGNDATPIVKPGPVQPTDRRLFIGTLDDANYNMYSMEYELSVGGDPIDPYNLPARIIEINAGNSNDGFFVTGTGVIDFFDGGNSYSDARGIFYFRVLHNLASAACVIMDQSTEPGLLTMSSLFYDSNEDEIYVSGSLINGNSNNGFLFDKIRNVSSGGIQPFSLTTWGNKIGFKELPTGLNGIPKSGIIGSTVTNGNKTVGRIYLNNTSRCLPVLLPCEYDDGNLSNWNMIGPTPIYYYPRQLDNVDPVQFYPGFNIDETWYPNHSSAELNIMDRFGMSGLLITTGSEKRLVINTTEAMYVNDCNYDQDDLTLSLLDIYDNGTVDIVDGAPDQTIDVLNYTNPTLGLSSAECTTPQQFKPTSEGEILTSDAQFVVWESGHEIMVQSTENAAYKIYNLNGQILYAQDLFAGTNVFNTSNLPLGLYFGQLVNDKEKKFKVFKFVKR